MKKSSLLLYIIIIMLIFQPKLSLAFTNFYFSDDNNSEMIDEENKVNNDESASEVEENIDSSDEASTEDTSEQTDNEEESTEEESSNEEEETEESSVIDEEESNSETPPEENDLEFVDENDDNLIDPSSEIDDEGIDDQIIDEEEFIDEEPEIIEPKIIYDYNSISVSRWISPKIAYLTFDDGPSSLTVKVLDILKSNNIKATFFVNGNNSEYGRKILKRIIDEGHTIGNHTYTHNYKNIYINELNFFKDLYKNEEFIFKSTGIKTNIVRLPGGSNNKVSIRYGGSDIMNRINNLLSYKGYTYFDWNTSSGDAATPAPTVEHIIYNVLNNASKNEYPVVLMHDSSSKTNTLKALPTIIQKLKTFGFSFDSLDSDSLKVVFNETKNKEITLKNFNNTPKLIKY